MPTVKVSVPHNLGADEAKKRITHLFTETKGQLGNTVTDVQESWIDNKGIFSFKAMGFTVGGNLSVESAVVDVEVNLPFAALPFKSKLENELTTRAKALLS